MSQITTYIGLFLFLFLIYNIVCSIVNTIFKIWLDLSFKIKLKFPKKYLNKVNPIYKIKVYENNPNLCDVHKFELKYTEDYFESWINMLCPIPIIVYTYNYVCTHSVNEVQVTKILGERQYKLPRTYEDFVKICEDDIMSRKKLKDFEENEKIIKENSKKSFEQQINKVFSENYFGK